MLPQATNLWIPRGRHPGNAPDTRTVGDRIGETKERDDVASDQLVVWSNVTRALSTTLAHLGSGEALEAYSSCQFHHLYGAV